MPSTSSQQIALLLFGDSELLPTEVDRLSPFTSKAGLNYGSFRLSAENPEGGYHRRYRQFKRDLLLTDSALNDRNRPRWKMLALYPVSGDRPKGLSQAELYLTGERNRPHYFSAVQATQLFLWRVCSHAVERVRELLPGCADVRVHFTVPAYDEEDAKNSRAKRYRDHLKQAIRGFVEARGEEFEGVDFRILNGKGEWLYEPYAAYYYYAALEQSEPFHLPGATYLIVDMGGSTTDFSLVQVHQEGSRFRKYPLCTSVQIGGADFDRYLLARFLEKGVPAQQEEQAVLLAEVERAKIQVCNGAAQARVVLGKRTFQLTQGLLRTSLKEFWERKLEPGSLAEGLANFIAAARHAAANNPLFQEFTRFDRVFLAGGSIQLIGLQDVLRKQLGDLGVEIDDEKAFVVPRHASPSSVTALGLAAELVQESEQLERAKAVYARIQDEKGRPYRFALPDVPAPADLAGSAEFEGATLVYSGALSQAYPPDANGKIKVENAVGVRSGYHPHPIPADGFPASLRFRFRNDIQETWPDEALEYAVESSKVNTLSPDAGDLIFSTELAARSNGEHAGSAARVRFKPSFFFQPRGGGKRVRLDASARTAAPEGRGLDIPLTRGRASGDVHICIDFGMSNTTVAVVAPNREIPEAPDLRIVRLTGGGAGAADPDATWEEADANGGQDGSAEPRDGDGPTPDPEEPGDAPAGGPAPGWEMLKGLAALETAQRELEARLTRLEAMSSAASTGSIDSLATRIGELVDAVATKDPAARPRPAHPRERANQHYRTIGQPRAAGMDRGLGSIPLSQLVGDFKAYLAGRDEDAHYPDHVLRAVLSECENPRARLTVLAGPPGTGKSSLVRYLAEFCNGDLPADDVSQSYFLLQPVAPAWYSSTSLLGSYSEIDGQFHGTPFLDHLYRAQEHVTLTPGTPPRLFFVCLDEFNLAAPEQYFAEFLSRMEADASSMQREIEVCTREEAAGLGDAIRVNIGANLRFFGTINIDASTHLLSPKVLDRAHLVRLTPSFQDLQVVGKRLAARFALRWFAEALAADQLLEKMCDLCTAARTPLGYRALARSYEYAQGFSPAEAADVLDDALCNFMLSRLPASFAVNSETYDERLESAGELFKKRKLTRARALIENVRHGLPGQHA